MSEISMTAKAVQDIQEYKEEVAEILRVREENKVSFHVGELTVENETLKLDGIELAPVSTKKVLAHLRVRPNFLGLRERMNEEDWEAVSQKLKTAGGNQIVFGRKTTGEKTNIVDLHLAHRKAPNGGIQIPEIFDLLTQSVLESSADDYQVCDKYFSDKTGKISLSLMNTTREVDVFGNGEDMWKTGKKIVWSGVDFGIYPFFERLVCANGNVAKQYGFSSSINNSKYNFGRIKAVLEREIMQASDAATPMLTDATRHLKRTNVSVAELLSYRNLFDEEEDEKILKKYFDMTYLNEAYRCDVEGMSKVWKVTADTGKNAYDFFNDLTYIASHPQEIKIDEEKRRRLQIVASDLLFKEELDLEKIAPKVSLAKR